MPPIAPEVTRKPWMIVVRTDRGYASLSELMESGQTIETAEGFDDIDSAMIAFGKFARRPNRTVELWRKDSSGMWHCMARAHT